MVIFGMVITSMSLFCCTLPTAGGGVENSSLAMVGATPYKLFLKVSWVNKQHASSDFTFKTRKKMG
jgi:hypothetical protein